MALPWALAILSLLPLLRAQDPACATVKSAPITNATLERISGRWFYIASVFRNPMFNESTRAVQTAFFYLTPNITEDVIFLREYQTIGGQCLYNSSHLAVQRANGTISRHVGGVEYIANLLFTKDPKTYMLSFYQDDELNRGLSFYADKQEVTKEQLGEFHEAIKCLGLQELEIVYIDGKKDRCGPLEKQHEEEKKKEKESQVDAELA